MGELDGKVAVITGAGSGMARACSRVFVREGAQVLAADISGREEETAAELGDAVKSFRVDVTKEEEVEAMFAAALEAFGRVDAVLNVAGIGGALLEHLEYDDAGNPVTTTLMDYLMPTAADVPMLEYGHVETPSPGPGGYKGVGEGGAIGAPPAVVNAVADALAPFGVRVTDLPLTPSAIVALLRPQSTD